jgi:hypothetical protein
VFEEARRTFEAVNDVFENNQKKGKLEFITKPKVEKIEGENILFLPYFLEVNKYLLNSLSLSE